jgi:hypothetical protein
MAVNDNNRPYGSFGCSASYSLWFEDSVLVPSGLDSDGTHSIRFSDARAQLLFPRVGFLLRKPRLANAWLYEDPL